MLAFRKLLAVALLILLTASCQQQHSAQQEATQALEELRALITEQNYKELGFESLAELSEMVLDTPLPVYQIGLSDLKDFERGQDPNTLLGEAHEMLYPIMVHDQRRSSVGVKKSGGGWEVASFGRAKLVRKLGQVRAQHARANNRDPADYFVVQIPSIYLIFLGHRVEGNLMLTHIHDQDDFDFEAGVTEAGHELIARILPVVKEHEGALTSTP